MGCEKEKESCHYLASEGVLAFGPVQNAADHLCLTYTRHDIRIRFTSNFTASLIRRSTHRA